MISLPIWWYRWLLDDIVAYMMISFTIWWYRCLYDDIVDYMMISLTIWWHIRNTLFLSIKGNRYSFRVITFWVITFCVRRFITFCVKKLLHFALTLLLHFASIVLHFALILHFAANVITFCGVTNLIFFFNHKFSMLVSNLERYYIPVNDVCKHRRFDIEGINNPLKEESTAKKS